MRALAGDAARTLRRTLGEARRRRGAHPPARVAAPPDPPPSESEAPAAGDAELDALRGALVHELDRLAARDDCSASFRRC
jgi:hypothetical protein